MKSRLDFTVQVRRERQRIDPVSYTVTYWQAYLEDVRPGNDMFWAEDYWEIKDCLRGFGEHIMDRSVRFRYRIMPI